ncbi:MAG TPA: cytochrome c, partial [Vicinamibacterales bacterium]|nr:cytochrome c [Vicinamibacterales bacterium]
MLLKTGRLAILSGFAALALAAGLNAATPTRIKSTEDMNSRAGPVINPETAPGRPLFEQHCAMCHLGGVPKAPSPNFLAMLAPDAIVSALTNGVMRQQAAALSPAEKIQVAEYL